MAYKPRLMPIAIVVAAHSSDLEIEHKVPHVEKAR
jgi:hypothetical protein